MNGWKKMQDWAGASCREARQATGNCRDKVRGCAVRVHAGMTHASEQVVRRLCEDKGQGTTEYAILVGVLVVIAIIAVAAFRENIQDLWDKITQGIKSL